MARDKHCFPSKTLFIMWYQGLGREKVCVTDKHGFSGQTLTIERWQSFGRETLFVTWQTLFVGRGTMFLGLTHCSINTVFRPRNIDKHCFSTETVCITWLQGVGRKTVFIECQTLFIAPKQCFSVCYFYWTTVYRSNCGIHKSYWLLFHHFI